MLYPVTIDDRIKSSPAILEGTVLGRQSYWNAAQDNIYTLHEIEVYKVFKWNLGTAVPQKFYMVTEGGTVGLIKQQVTSVLDLEPGQTGIFFCNPSQININGVSQNLVRFESNSGPQGFIRFDEQQQFARDPYEMYTINPDLYNYIMDAVGAKFTEIKTYPANNSAGIAAVPVINSFTPDSASAGTTTTLTIDGSNFGATRGSGYVGFKNADNGGTNFIKPQDVEYISWSDNQIKVKVTARAGTGKILVHNGVDSVQSSTSLVVNFAMLNVVDGSNIVYQPVHINDNGLGGYTWQFFTDFNANTDAKQSFLRAFQNWRCGTLVNWDIGSVTNIDVIARDNVQVIRFDNGSELPNGVLGRCSSWWSGCVSGSNTLWYVDELDIVFDDATNWNFGPGNPSFTQYDFESVAVHELGHGHQLGHVIDAGEIMHYSIANSQVKRTLSSKGDLKGGNYVMDLNASGARCGKTAMSALNPNFCSLIPVANFGSSATTVCPTVTITFTDSSNGSTNTYDWDFGTGASPATATGKGPHIVNYSTPGLKTIRLIVGGVLGDDTIEKVNFINVLPPPPAKPGIITGTDTGCIRTSQFTILKVTDATSYSWGISSGGTTNNSTDTAVGMNFTTAGGPYTIWVKASNSCGISADSSTKQINVVANPVSNFTVVIQHDTIFLTNTSADAYQFTWKFGAGQTSNFTNLSLIPQSSGTYNITLLASNFCGTDSITKQVSFIKSGINELLNKIGLKLYPNPATTRATVEVELFAAGMVLELYDITGRKVQVSELAATTSTVDVGALSKGVYMYKIISATETLAAGRLVVE